MQNLTTQLEKLIEPALLKVTGLCETPEIMQSAQEHFGHYQCNNALRLAKQLKTNPRALAEKIVAAIEDKKGAIAKLEIAGPGFINIFLNPEYLAAELNTLFGDPRLGIPSLLEKKRIVVEFSSPNIAKELHVGHLRSTIIGDAIARLLEFLGHDVIRLNHIGDWGTQFGMLISYLKAFQPKVIKGSEKASLSELMNWYREAKKHFDEDVQFKKQSQEEVVKLQSGDPTSLKAWRSICDISRDAFQNIYKILDIEIEERGESFYNPMLAEIVKELEQKDLITESEGAKCLFLEGFTGMDGSPLPMIVQKSDGGYNYSTTDMAAMKHRSQILNADRIVVVTDAGQQLHFQMIAAASEKLGSLDPKKTLFNHVTFGVVLGADGKKFKTRSGATEPLIGLLTEAVDRAYALLKERMENVSEEALTRYAHILGIDAVKYADLSCHRIKDYVFSYDRMLNFEGNTAAYLLYSYVRIQGIKRKVGKAVEELKKCSKITLIHPSEIALALQIRQFGEALDMMDRDLLPNRLSDYLYNLAEKFHAFFRDCRVEGSEEEHSRLLLSELTGLVLAQGLQILGLKTMDRM